MDAALLNVKVTFQKNMTVTDGIGNHTNMWEDFHTCHATVSGEGGGEKQSAGITADDSEIAFTIRWCVKASEITTTGYRVLFGTETYDITFVDHMNYKRKSLKFRCTKTRRR